MADEQAKSRHGRPAGMLLHAETRLVAPRIATGGNSRIAGYAIRKSGDVGGGLSDGAPYPDRAPFILHSGFALDV